MQAAVDLWGDNGRWGSAEGNHDWHDAVRAETGGDNSGISFAAGVVAASATHRGGTLALVLELSAAVSLGRGVSELSAGLDGSMITLGRDTGAFG